jgi:hypothetical protein
MELGHTLILRDCGIFGALYEMLNQNYSVVGGRRNCRIALGPHSNPMCAVHEDFRAVVTTPAQAAAADPSLLNRCEKQWLDAQQLLPVSYQKLLLHPLQQWVAGLGAASSSCSDAGSSSSGVSVSTYGSSPGSMAVHSAGSGSSGSSSSREQALTQPGFAPSDLFLGLHADSLPSLLLKLSGRISGSSHGSSSSSTSALSSGQHLLSNPSTQQSLLAQCQQALIATASLDGVARACSNAAGTIGVAGGGSRNPVQQGYFKQLVESYLVFPKHSMRQLVEHQLAQHLQQQQQQQVVDTGCAASGASGAAPPEIAVQLWYVMTRSAPHTAVVPLLNGLADVQELFLGHIKSEAELRQQLQLFLGTITCSSSNSNSSSIAKSSALPVKLLVFHADAPAAAAEPRHLGSLVVECVKAAGHTSAGWTDHVSAAATAARSADSGIGGPSSQPHVAQVRNMPLVAVCVVLHLPMAAAASRASSTAAAAAATTATTAAGSAVARPSRARLAAATSNQAAATCIASAAASPLVEPVTPDAAVNASSSEDSWQANYLSSWQQVTVDALEGLAPWLLQLLSCSLRAAAGLPLQANSEPSSAAAAAAAAGATSSRLAGVPPAAVGAVAGSSLAAAAVAALPPQQMLQDVLLQALCSLPYPNTAQAAVRVKHIAEQLLPQPAANAQQQPSQNSTNSANSLWGVLVAGVCWL